MALDELRVITQKVWTGREILKIRELNHKLSIFDVRDVLIGGEGTFLTKSEILFLAMEMKGKQVSERLDLSFFCAACGELNEEEMKISELPFQEFKMDRIEIEGVGVKSREPDREKTRIDRSLPTPRYDLLEMLACLEIEGVENPLEWVLNLGVGDFQKLEAFYNVTCFRFNPSISLKCDCGYVTKLKIDSFPLEGME